METAELVPILPSELLIEILSRLPIKTLMQLRCVSKSWKSLISEDKDLVKLHLKRSPKNRHVIVTLQDRYSLLEYVEFYAISCPVRSLLKESSSTINEDGCCNLKAKYFVVGSCNGLVCLRGFYDLDTMGEFWVRLWNPTTRLRSNKSPTFYDNTDSVSFGFGYDDLCDTYKVVALSSYYCNRKERKLETIVHCMNADSGWRKIMSNPGFPFSPKQIDGLFAGGCINWLALNELKYPKQFVIVSFDMHKEVYRSLSLPEGANNEGTSHMPNLGTHLAILENCLYLFQDQKRTHFVVWQMREYGVRESWTRLVSVSYEPLGLRGGFQFDALRMCLSEDGDTLLLVKGNPDVFMYNLRDNSVKNVQLLPDNIVWYRAIGHDLSLVSPC